MKKALINFGEGVAASAAAMIVFDLLFITRYVLGVSLIWVNLIGIGFGLILWYALSVILFESTD